MTAAPTRWDLPLRPGVDEADLGDIEALGCLIYGAEERAKTLLESEVPFDDDAFLVEPILPEITVRDAAGREITGARLERAPGTDRFVLFLLTTPVPPTQPE